MAYSYVFQLVRIFLLLACTDLIESDKSESVSVGKTRASAEVAYSNGEIDLALKLWGQV